MCRDDQLQLRKEKYEKLSMLDQQLDKLTKEVKNKIKTMVEDVERKVGPNLYLFTICLLYLFSLYLFSLYLFSLYLFSLSHFCLASQ